MLLKDAWTEPSDVVRHCLTNLEPQLGGEFALNRSNNNFVHPNEVEVKLASLLLIMSDWRGGRLDHPKFLMTILRIIIVLPHFAETFKTIGILP